MKKMSRSIPSRDRFVSKMTVEDDKYLKQVQQILIAEPCRGVPTEPAKLIGHVYIGSQANAESLRLLRRLGVTHVLNCAGFKGPRKTPDVSPYEGLDIDYYEFQAEDNDSYNITRHFQEAFAFLAKVERSGGVCLIHCAMGVNRSAATCAAYIMQHKNWSLLKVIQLLKDKRRVVLSNVGFRWQLVKFARSKNLLDQLEEPPKKKTHDWFEEEVEYITERIPKELEIYEPKIELPKTPKYSEEMAEMDELSKCINEALNRESRVKSRKPDRRYVSRDK